MKPSAKYRIRKGAKFSMFILQNEQIVDAESLRAGDIFISVEKANVEEVLALIRATNNVWWKDFNVLEPYKILTLDGRLGILYNSGHVYFMEDYIEEL